MKTPLSVFLLIISFSAIAKADVPVFDIPKIDGVTIDGKSNDWSEKGFCVEVLGGTNGKLTPAAAFDSAFRLGWDERGLLVLVNVTEIVHDEANEDNELWKKNSVEIFYAPQRSSRDVFQVVISPGLDPKHPELRFNIHDHRKSEALKHTNATVTAVRTKTANGYTLEALLPWENLGIKPEAGRELAFQICVNDTVGGDRFQAMWYPLVAGAGDDSTKMQRVRLSDKPSPPINAVVSGEYERFRRACLHVAGRTDLVGKTFTVKEGGRELGSIPITADGDRAWANLVLPMPPLGKAYGPLDVSLDGQPVQTYNLPDAQVERAKAFMEQRLKFDPNVFSGTKFPKCDFEQPSCVEDLIGPYTITAKFYDANYNPVTTAEKPGRYGAVVEIKTEDGKTFRRLLTLFRTQQKLSWWAHTEVAGSIGYPQEIGINPTVAKEQKHSTEKYLSLLLEESFSRDAAAPALTSALYETKPGAKDTGISEDFLTRDRQWWVGLKRKLAGTDKLYPQPFVCPQAVTEMPTTVLHEGIPKEAGMKPDAAEKIDTLLKQWSADTDEAFAVCIARHGVIVLHKAYGQRDGKPMTVNTKCWMASITKAMSGSAMMMLVNQGLVNLDDPVAKFLPAFSGVPVPTPLTVRHLYTHTNGLQGHWGDDLNDFDDVIAGYYPFMEVGKRHEYNGAGLALGSKIVESITGEALPQFYKHHLLDPLGCANTTVTNSSYDAQTTPMDLAKIGQMLLNRGSYGDKQFMSAETFQQMLPARLTKVLGPDTTLEWGIGLVWFKDDGLGKGTFGHGAASSTTLRIDPEHDLVIVMTRNAMGRNFIKYHPKFLASIMENLAE